MADYTHRRVTTVREEYALRSPTNATEVSKAMAGIVQDLKAAGREIFDDTITVTACDDEIVLSYEKEPSDLDNDFQRQSDLISELGRSAKAALQRVRENSASTVASLDHLDEIAARMIAASAKARNSEFL